MLNSVDFSGRPFHFIGIGGIGMSALAHVLASRKLPVSGSDLRLSHITERLEAQGAHIFNQQQAENLAFFTGQASSQQAATGSALKVQKLPQVVCSTAIGASNPEYQEAIAIGCPIFHRSDILAALMNEHKGIAIAGTHGKTTTSSITGYLLLKAGVDPTIIIGGEVSTWSGNAYVGQSDYVVAEADESDGSLVKLASHIGVITNIELDHPDHYSSLDQVIEIFDKFVEQCETVIGSIDCPTVRELLFEEHCQRIKPVISYSVNADSGADYVAKNIRETAEGTIAEIWERGESLGEITVPLLGLHNLSNAIASIAVARQLGVSFATLAQHMPNFGGARRRFEHRGFYSEILFVDDYAHHPSEVRATLAAAQVQRSGVLSSGRDRKVVAVFQPHRYSRAATLLNEFATAFEGADRVLVTDIYSAGETNTANITGEQVAAAIAQYQPNTEYHGTLTAVTQALKTSLNPGDIVIFLTAGNLNQIIPDVMSAYQTAAQSGAIPSGGRSSETPQPEAALT
ncbi:MAG: UDP-N-acetylmuramate--alanine ligase MurC [Phormidesmis priestleyi Ana]|uniref:UDP-N-acetylmuramate--L-alanine ligase n=1 Tax=Phormidesmis priestleyi Ana TaxID=1666911 RepID=A0A0P7Z1C1_9CYAN|nr:MAG: UDP-N-acetylmuramate--alanine ligase MurC [Phormidesmis priestleyi Ana]